MTHDELLEAVKDNPTTLAVVELHKPMYYDTHPTLQCPCGHCEHREWDVWPCPTIQAIEGQLK